MPQNEDTPTRCGTGCVKHQNQGGECAAHPMESVDRGCYEATPATPVTPAAVRAVAELTKRFWWSAEQQAVGSRIITDEYAGQDAAAGKLIQGARRAAHALRFLDYYGTAGELEGLANRLESAMKGSRDAE